MIDRYERICERSRRKGIVPKSPNHYGVKHVDADSDKALERYRKRDGEYSFVKNCVSLKKSHLKYTYCFFFISSSLSSSCTSLRIAIIPTENRPAETMQA